MNQVSHTWIAFALYTAVTGALAYRGWRRTKSMEGFIVGNRDIHPAFVGLSLAAQLTSVATFIINPGLVYAYGLSSLLGLGGAAALGIIVGAVIISKGFRRVGEQISAVTVPGWLGSRYRSRGLQGAFFLLSLALISFMVLIVVAPQGRGEGDAVSAVAEVAVQAVAGVDEKASAPVYQGAHPAGGQHAEGEQHLAPCPLDPKAVDV